MSASPYESALFSPLISDSEVAALFSDDTQIRAMVEVEVALARVQSDLGVIPEQAANSIAAIAQNFSPDLEAIRRSTEQSGVPVIGLVAELRKVIGGEAAAYVHWGATSQDIMDTALVLRLRRLLAIYETRLDTLIGTLSGLARKHADTVMAGRTRGQQALPITFGLKVAGWLAPLLRQSERLAELKPRLLVVQFGGASGTLAALDDRGVEVMEALAKELKLGVPLVPWHAQRDSLAELASWLSLLTGLLGKIGGDVGQLAQSEVGEVSEGGEGRGGSSTMPQKSNPIASETLVALAGLNAGLLATFHHTLLSAHERGGAQWTMEWALLPQMALNTAAALRHASELITGLQVDGARMRQNLEASAGLILAEAASFALSRHMPREQAHGIVKRAVQETAKSGRHLMDVLQKLTDAPVEWRELGNPARYLGAARKFIDRVLASAKR